MDSAHRNTIRIIFVRIPPQLKELVSRVPETYAFTKRHGRLLNMVTSRFDEKMMGVTSNSLIPSTTTSPFQTISWCLPWKNSLSYWIYPFLNSCLSQVWTQSGAYIAWGYPTLFSHSYNEEKRCSYVLQDRKSVV